MIKAIVTDIEGTTSSLSFVKDVLFPYARNHLADFVRQHLNEPPVRVLLDQANAEAGGELDDDQVVDQLIRWIDEDRKATPLKSLQGLIWEHGYRNGDFTGHVYADAAENLRQWHDQGIRLYVYSSGSVYAQKLLFAHTDYGDLTPLFSGYFDTHIGHKQEAGSYRQIALDLALAPDEILFLSDIRQELDAAAAAGMQTCWVVRDQAPNTEATHTQVESFNGINI
jgi:enolase-phosphatase E1